YFVPFVFFFVFLWSNRSTGASKQLAPGVPYRRLRSALMELAIKGHDAGSTPAHQIANLRACSSTSRMLRGRSRLGLSYLPIATVAFRSNFPQPTTTPLIAVKTDRAIT